MNEKYYTQVGKIVKLHKEGKNIIATKLYSRKCTQCGGKVVLASYIDGNQVACVSDQQHKTGYTIDMDEPSYEAEPKLVSEK